MSDRLQVWENCCKAAGLVCSVLIMLLLTGSAVFAQSIVPVIFETGFEPVGPPIAIGISKTGNFIEQPDIKPNTHFGSAYAFGFGKSDCAADCWENNTATLRIELAGEVPIASISFDEAELGGNWGSTGYVYVDGHLVNDGVFERLPWNDGVADTSFRHRNLTVNLVGSVIEFKVIDITSTSEMFIDNIAVCRYGGTTDVFSRTYHFDDPEVPYPLFVQTKGTFIQPPGIRHPAVLGGSGAFGFGKSTNRYNSYNDYTASLILDLGSPYVIEYIMFREAELDTNWGNQGLVLIDNHEVPYSAFGRLPSNDRQIDTSPRMHYIPVNQIGQKITLKAWDITDLSELVIDDFQVIFSLPHGGPVMREDFEDNVLAPELSVQSAGTFISPPGIQEASGLGGIRAFGFGQSDCSASCLRANQSTLTCFFPKGIDLLALKFKAMEQLSNWGSQGELYVNGQLLPGMDFCRQPSNDLLPDSTCRSYLVHMYIRVYEIKWTVWDITTSSQVFVDDIELIPKMPQAAASRDQQAGSFTLLQNYPNPFNASTTIHYSLDRATRVMLTIYNSEGQTVEKRELGLQPAGPHQVEWNAEKYSSGNYFCRLETAEVVRVIPLVLIR